MVAKLGDFGKVVIFRTLGLSWSCLIFCTEQRLSCSVQKIKLKILKNIPKTTLEAHKTTLEAHLKMCF